MTADRELSLAHHFADLTDPRIDRSRLHELLDIVAIAICAVVAGADSWDDIEDFGTVKHDWLKTFLGLPNGIPSHDTFRRLFEPIAVFIDRVRRHSSLGHPSPAAYERAG